MNFAALVKEAKAEVKQKSSAQIEKETAYKWAARAVACLELEVEAMKDNRESEIRPRRPQQVELWKRRYYDYEHEALEHAAMVKDEGHTLDIIIRWFEEATDAMVYEIGG